MKFIPKQERSNITILNINFHSDNSDINTLKILLYCDLSNIQEHCVRSRQFLSHNYQIYLFSYWVRHALGLTPYTRLKDL